MERSIRVGGLNVRYLEHGEGAPAILLHGASLGSSADVWARNLAPLAAHRLRVIAPDLPGFGGTDNPEDHSVGYRRRFVPAFMDALELPCAALVGHSQSGRIAVDLAIGEPQRVAKVVVLGTGSLLPQLPGNSQPATEGEEGSLAEPTLDESRRLLESNLYHRGLATEDAVALRHRMSVGKNFEAFAARKSSRGNKADKSGEAPWQRLARCPVPLLLLYGEQDRGDAARRAALARQLNPLLDLLLLPRSAHLVQWDAAEAFAQLAGRFLAGE
jgi:pimeloyl-ACP methyl ester carboxylesterase